MTEKKDNHRKERAKKLLSASHKKGGKADMMKSMSKKGNGGLTGAAPTAFPVGGNSPRKRQDKRQRYATGGGVEDGASKKKSGAKTEVNIVIAGKGDQGAPMPQPVPAPMGPPPGAMPPPGGMPPRPMPPGGMPPAGMRPPGAMRRGGGVKEEYPIDAGAGGGKGRLEKAAAEKRKDKGKKRDGKS